MKRIITIIVLQSILLVAGDKDDTGFYTGKKVAKHLRETVQIGLTRVEAMQTALPATAGLAGKEFGSNLIDGATDNMGKRVNEGGQYLAGLATAALATPAAPYVIATGAGIITLGATLKLAGDWRERGFRRCLNTHFASDLNDRGFPSRCESPERRSSWWHPDESDDLIKEYRKQRNLVKKISKG